MKLVLVEGLDDYLINNVIDQITEPFNLIPDSKSIILNFPRYKEKSGILVNRHINEFPKPNLKKSYRYLTNIKGISKDDLVFISNRNDYKFRLVKILSLDRDYSKYNVVVEDCISGERFCISHQNEEFTFYECLLDNIIDWGCKASETTKALFFTIDRNVCFTNNRKKMEEADFVFVNRSHLSNFLYRTKDIQTEEEFLEYIISIYRIEIVANNFEDVEIHSFFLRYNNLEKEREIVKNIVLKNYPDEMDKLERMFQYTETINKNYDHLQDLINRTKKKYPDIYKKYAKYVETELIEVTDDDLNEYYKFETIGKIIAQKIY